MTGETCFEKVELWIAAVATGLTDTGEALDGWTVATNQSRDVALDVEDASTVVVATQTMGFEEFEEPNQNIVTQIVTVEFVSGNAPAATLRPENLRAAANFHAALAADRTLGGKVQDIRENDIAPGDTEGRDLNSASVQYTVTYFVRRDDWFYVIGADGIAN
jgi:hypothetical protein